MPAAVSQETKILAGLRKAFNALPKELKLNGSGSGGVFTGGAAGIALGKAAIEQGLLTTKEEKGSGKKAKQVIYGVITEKGIQRIVDADPNNPKSSLESLLPVLQALGVQTALPNIDAIRVELVKATETCVSALTTAFTRLETEVLKVVAPPPAIDTSLVLNALHRALERVKAPVIPASPPPISRIPANYSPPEPAIAEEIVSFVKQWVQEKTVGCQFDVLFKHLKERHTELTVGAFQDALRKLHDSERIRLGGWPRMLDDIPQPELALFVSSKVMYYAQLSA